MNNKELAHRFANGATSGKGSNMFIDGNTIYSYGKHFPIARIISIGKGAEYHTVVLFNTKGYSNTTAKHKSYVYRAIHTATVFTVPSLGYGGYLELTKTDHSENLKYYEIEIKRELDKAARSVKYSGMHLENVERIKKEATEYAKEFKLRLPAFFNKPFDLVAIKERIAKQAKAAKEAKRKAEHKAAKLFAQIRALIVPAWINGIETVNNPNGEGSANTDSNIYKLPEVYLREKAGNVETSKGAKVSTESAKMLFEMLVNGRDIKGHVIDGYTVIGLNGVLTIGCHKIERTEINRFAASQGWTGSIPEKH